jgi:hypothetical protein
VFSPQTEAEGLAEEAVKMKRRGRPAPGLGEHKAGRWEAAVEDDRQQQIRNIAQAETSSPKKTPSAQVWRPIQGRSQRGRPPRRPEESSHEKRLAASAQWKRLTDSTVAMREYDEP